MFEQHSFNELSEHAAFINVTVGGSRAAGYLRRRFALSHLIPPAAGAASHDQAIASGLKHADRMRPPAREWIAGAARFGQSADVALAHTAAGPGPCRPTSANDASLVIDRARSRIEDAGTSLSLGGNRPLDRRETAGLGLAPEGGQQPGLADPSLAGEQEELAPPGGDVFETPIREDEQVVTPDEERATDGPHAVFIAGEVSARRVGGHRSFDR